MNGTCDAELNSRSGSIALARPRSSCTTRSTKNMSLGNLSTGSALMGLSGSKGFTLQGDIAPPLIDLASATPHNSGIVATTHHGTPDLQATWSQASAGCEPAPAACVEHAIRHLGAELLVVTLGDDAQRPQRAVDGLPRTVRKWFTTRPILTAFRKAPDTKGCD